MFGDEGARASARFSARVDSFSARAGGALMMGGTGRMGSGAGLAGLVLGGGGGGAAGGAGSARRGSGSSGGRFKWNAFSGAASDTRCWFYTRLPAICSLGCGVWGVRGGGSVSHQRMYRDSPPRPALM